MAKSSADETPNRPEGILDMMGPRTLEGGYSPSQVMSSAMEREVVLSVAEVIFGAEKDW